MYVLDLNDKKLLLSSVMKLTDDFGCDIAGLSSTELHSVISLESMLSSSKEEQKDGQRDDVEMADWILLN